MEGRDTQPLKYPSKTRFPLLFGGVLLMLGGAFLLRKYYVLDNDEARKTMYRTEDEEAKSELVAFKKEYNKNN